MSELSSLGKLVPMDAASMPAEVRKAGKAAQETYRAAVGFEQILVKQLTEALSKSAAFGAGENGESGAPAAYKDMVADNMATAIATSGGMGIADALYKNLTENQGGESK